MYKQYEYLREGVTFTRGQTYRIDLPETGLLSTLLLKVSGPCTSGATLATDQWRLQDFLGRIEIIANGATIIKSADYKHFDYLQWLYSGASPMHAWRNYATNTQFEYLLLHFGRYAFDPDYGLDLSKYDNVELRFTNSSSATYHGSDLSLSLLQGFLRDKSAGFRGHIRTELWRSWATVQNETKYLLLPTEYPISLIALRALPDTTTHAADTGFANLMTDIDFSVGGGQTRLFKGGLDDLALMAHLERGAEADVFGAFDRTADKPVDVSLGRILGWATAATALDGAGAATIPTIQGDSTDGTVNPETREADSPIAFIFKGYAYQHMVALHDNRMLNPDLMIEPTRAGEMRLNIQTADSAAAADGTAEVVLERVVP